MIAFDDAFANCWPIRNLQAEHPRFAHDRQPPSGSVLRLCDHFRRVQFSLARTKKFEVDRCTEALVRAEPPWRDALWHRPC